MSKVVAWTNNTGVAIITIPTPSLIQRMGGIDGAIAHILSRADCIPPDAQSVSVRNASDVPPDLTFRDAWKPDLTVDMPKAREIHLNRIRAARDRELAKLDVDLTKALAQKNDTKVMEVEAERQALRDIPQTFDLTVAATPDQLKALWPTKLPRT